jgi:hypothetical protein
MLLFFIIISYFVQNNFTFFNFSAPNFIDTSRFGWGATQYMIMAQSKLVPKVYEKVLTHKISLK